MDKLKWGNPPAESCGDSEEFGFDVGLCDYRAHTSSMSCTTSKVSLVNYEWSTSWNVTQPLKGIMWKLGTSYKSNIFTVDRDSK